jgi:hypothetical protein
VSLVARRAHHVNNFDNAVGFLQEGECVLDLVSFEELERGLVQLEQYKGYFFLRHLQFPVVVLAEAFYLVFLSTLRSSFALHFASFL